MTHQQSEKRASLFWSKRGEEAAVICFDKPFVHVTPLSPKPDQVRDAIAEIRLEFPPSPEHEDNDSSPAVEGDEKSRESTKKTTNNDGDDAADGADDKDKVCRYLKPRMSRTGSHFSMIIVILVRR